MNTFLNYLGTMAVFALFLAPVLAGIAREHRIDRQLRVAERERRAQPPDTADATRPVRAAWRRELRIGARAQRV
ncbi:hypothetical protein ACFVXE_34965 [Streptomyces sp. NPDC058231]|uniref:hypothetical protein n=1 Tax=Streptomyces sp. NPDC058231 TaxID=3346392 RepID=UPI0036EFB326